MKLCHAAKFMILLAFPYLRGLSGLYTMTVAPVVSVCLEQHLSAEAEKNNLNLIP
jgi:hypothetical protein